MGFPTKIKKPDYTYRVKVAKVVDGDTIDVDVDLGFYTWTRKRLRFIAIDAYEIYRGTVEEKAKGQLAKQFVKDSLYSADRVYIQTTMDSTGKYGRVLAWVWYEKDDVMYNLNKQLLDEGHAVLYVK